MRQVKQRFLAYGTAFGLRGGNRALRVDAAERVRALGWTEAPGDDVAVEFALTRRRSRDLNLPWSYDLQSGGELLRRTTNRDEFLDAFENHAKIQTAYHAKDRLFVHAGVVAWCGGGIVMPGRSHAGKSTLVKALVDAGAEYYSDEFAVIDRKGRVHPFLVPISIRANAAQPAMRTSVDALNGRVGRAAVTIQLILVSEYCRGARWRPHVLSRAEAFLALMENTVAARQPPERTMPVLRQAVLSATSFRSRRGEAPAVARALLAALG